MLLLSRDTCITAHNQHNAYIKDIKHKHKKGIIAIKDRSFLRVFFTLFMSFLPERNEIPEIFTRENSRKHKVSGKEKDLPAPSFTLDFLKCISSMPVIPVELQCLVNSWER